MEEYHADRYELSPETIFTGFNALPGSFQYSRRVWQRYRPDADIPFLDYSFIGAGRHHQYNPHRQRVSHGNHRARKRFHCADAVWWRPDGQHLGKQRDDGSGHDKESILYCAVVFRADIPGKLFCHPQWFLLDQCPLRKLQFRTSCPESFRGGNPGTELRAGRAVRAGYHNGHLYQFFPGHHLG